MLKIWSMKQQQQKSEAAAGGAKKKKVTAAQLRVQKGQCYLLVVLPIILPNVASYQTNFVSFQISRNSLSAPP